MKFLIVPKITKLGDFRSNGQIVRVDPYVDIIEMVAYYKYPIGTKRIEKVRKDRNGNEKKKR